MHGSSKITPILLRRPAEAKPQWVTVGNIDSANLRDYYKYHIKMGAARGWGSVWVVANIQGESDMADTARLQIGDQSVELPIVEGSENEKTSSPHPSP